jgi:putative flippase GtrA
VNPRRLAADLGRYAVASAFSFGLVLGLSASLHELVGLSETLAVALALALAFAANFTLLRRWVFPGQVAPVHRQAAATALASIAFRLVEYGVFLALHLGLEINYLLATAASLCLSAAGKFAVYRGLIFNPARATARSAAPATAPDPGPGSPPGGTAPRPPEAPGA